MTSPVRVLHITRERGSDARYGIGKSLAPVLAALRAQGHQVTLHDGEASAAALPADGWGWLGRRLMRGWLRWLTPSGSSDPAVQVILGMVEERAWIAWTAARLVARGKYTHVHCHDPILAWLYARFVRLQHCSAPRPRWGVTEHAFGMFVQNRLGVTIPPLLLCRLQGWERWVVARADWVCAPSTAGLQQLAKDLGCSAESALPAHWRAVPHPRPALTFPSRTEARARLGVHDADWLLLGVGQLIPLKRWECVLAAFARLPCTSARLPRLLLLGEGDGEALRQQAARLGVSERLRLEVTDDIALYFAAADAYVSASSTESFGMANCEALAAGLPAICTAVGAVPGIVGEAAWLLEDADDSDVLVGRLQQALTTLLVDPVCAARWATAARCWGEQWLTPEQVARQMLTLYRQVV